MAKKQRAAPPQSVFGRTSRMLFSGAKIAAREVSERLAASIGQSSVGARLETRIKQTQDLVAALSQLKGAAMKAGQLLSLEFSDLLPKEVLAVLRQLNDSGSFMPYSKVRAILRRELTTQQLQNLENLSEEPIAAASIGQVHRATLAGKPVAVKIQFPGITKTIDSDLSALRRLISSYLRLAGKDIHLEEVFAELGSSLKLEADYTSEAASMQRYRSLLRHPSLIVPQVELAYSSKRVLTLSFEDGQRISDWLESAPSADEILRFSTLIIELLIHEFFVTGLVQTDPNYGNFLYRPDRRELVLLDFGATYEYSTAFRREILELMSHVVNGNRPKVWDLAVSWKWIDPRESAETKELFLSMLMAVGAIFRTENQPFNFSDISYLTTVRDISMRFLSSIQYSAPARQVLFLNRKLGGMFHLLKDAGAVLDMHRYFQEVQNLDFQ